MEDAIKKADVLIEALPYIKNFRHKLFVIKYGGSILSEESIRESVLEDIVFLYFMGIDVILVHGGGPNITNSLKERGLKSEFFEGVRVTDKPTLEVVEEELRQLNRMLAKEMVAHEANVIGLEGKNNIVYVKKKTAAKDLGFVGEVIDVNKKQLEDLLLENHIIVLSPTGLEKVKKDVYNVNADETASFVAGIMEAEKFVFLTDVLGVMKDPKDKTTLISSMKKEDVATLIEQGVITGGMIPKVLACKNALDIGVKKVHIIDAKIPHALLLEIFTDQGIGTEITK